MPDFKYKARGKDGQPVQGVLSSGSRSQVARKITEMGYYPVEISQVRQRAGLLPKWRWKIPVSEVVVFFRQLATMQEAGLPVVYSLNTLAEGTRHGRFRQIVDAVRNDIEGGESLSSAMGQHPEAFNEVAVNMVRVGEASGNLAGILERLADYGERSEELRSRVRNAMVYPIILSVTAVGVVAFSLIFVLPRFAAIFAKMKVPLPLPTRIIMWISQLVVDEGILLLAALVMAAFIFRILIHTDRGKWIWDGWLFRFPVFGKVRLKNLTARFARNLGTLVESGVDILFSFEVSERTLPSVRLERALRVTRENVREGESIAPVLESQGVFPPLVPRMIGVGEETGRLGAMLERLAVYYELEVEMAVKRLTTLLQPFLIIVMAGIVAFVAAATLLPLFNMIKHIR